MPRFQADSRYAMVSTALFLVRAMVLGLALAVLPGQQLRGVALFVAPFVFPLRTVVYHSCVSVSLCFIIVHFFILFPISLPAIAVAPIFQFTNIWNDILFGIAVVPDPRAQPVTIVLNNLSGSFLVECNVEMAEVVLAAFPSSVEYIGPGKLFVRGLVLGAVKA